ncbi:hypothetical protein SFR_4387 [Streptomyces sp. FR-008]|nr:hypothetical protein SFR_4387 [Streptomyces sp. FR-008]
MGAEDQVGALLGEVGEDGAAHGAVEQGHGGGVFPHHPELKLILAPLRRPAHPRIADHRAHDDGRRPVDIVGQVNGRPERETQRGVTARDGSAGGGAVGGGAGHPGAAAGDPDGGAGPRRGVLPARAGRHARHQLHPDPRGPAHAGGRGLGRHAARPQCRRRPARP